MTSRTTVKVVLGLLEIAAAFRAGVATWNVTMHVSGGDVLYSIFTVIVVEGVFLASLFMIGNDAVAPISAVFALVFSGIMQYLELAIMQGELTAQENVMVRAVVAFAPIVILLFAFLRRIVSDEQIEAAVDVVKAKAEALTQKPQKAEQKPQTSDLTPEQIAAILAMADKAQQNGGTYKAEVKKPDF